MRDAFVAMPGQSFESILSMPFRLMVSILIESSEQGEGRDKTIPVQINDEMAHAPGISQLVRMFGT